MTIRMVLFFTCQILTISCFSLTVDEVTPEKGIVFSYNIGYPAIGYSVSSAGDIDGDGLSDVLIGAPGVNSCGVVYVIYGTGKPLGKIDFTVPLDPKLGLTLRGSITGGKFGASVSNVGDFNGDGISDIVVSAPSANYSAGIVYLIYGSKTRRSDLILDLELDPKDGFVIFGNYGDSFGTDVDDAGDVNGDGLSDVIVGSPGFSFTQGKAYIIYGKQGFVQGNIYTSTLDPSQGFWITGTITSQFGKAVSGAGDINGDGIDDILIGSPAARRGTSLCGKAYVIFGSQTSLLNKDLETQALNPNEGFSVTGVYMSNLGASVSGVGDINDDGYDDVAIGATRANNGQVYVIYGGNKTFASIDLTSSSVLPSQGFTINAQAPLKPIGYAVNAAGDFNGDGVADLLLGSAPLNRYLGGVLILNGEKGGETGLTVSSSLDPLKWSYFTGKGDADAIGYSVSSAGDFNGDGIDDVIFGSTDAFFGVGGAWMVFGQNGCPKYCKTCDGSLCLSCFLDYGIQGTKCKKCEKDSNGLCLGGSEEPEQESIDCPVECMNCTSGLVCQACNEGYIMLNSQVCVSNELSSQANITSAIFDGSSIVGNSLCVGSSLPTNLGFASKMVRNTRYLNVPVSNTLQSAFQTWKTRSDFLSAPKSWDERNNEKSLPIVFERYHVDHAFLVNYWRTLIMILIGIGLFIALRALNYYLFSKSTKKTVRSSVIQSMSISALNFALAQIYSSLDDIIFFFALNMRGKGTNTAFENANFAFAIILLLLLFALAGFHIYLVMRYQTLKRKAVVSKGHKKPLDEFLKKYENIKIIYADFNDHNLPQQIFLLVNAFRAVLASLFMVTLFDYPLVQTIILTVLCVSMLTYLYIFKPFRECINTYAQYFCEIILLIVNVCMLILVCIAKSGIQAKNAVERLSKAVVVLNMMMIIGSSIFFLAMIFLMLYGIYQERRRRLMSINPVARPKTAMNSRSKVYESNSPPLSDSGSSSPIEQRPQSVKGSSDSSKSDSEGALLNSTQHQGGQVLDVLKTPLGLDTSNIQIDKPFMQDPSANDPLDGPISPSGLMKESQKSSKILGELEFEFELCKQE